MKLDIEKTAKEFKLNPHNPKLQNEISNYIITKFESFIRKYSFTYPNYENSDVDSIITDVFCRIQKNIEKWDDTLCQFKTWLYSCIQNEIRAYFTTKEKFYSKFLTETKLSGTSGDDEREDTESNIFVNLVEDNEIEKEKIKIIKKGSVEVRIKNPDKRTTMEWVLYDEENNIVEIQQYIRTFKDTRKVEIISKDDTIKDDLVLRNGRKRPRRKYYVNYVETVDGYLHENDDLELARLAVRNIMDKELDDTQKKFMFDYLSGNFSYNELVDKYEVPLSSVKNWVHKNKRIIKEKLHKFDNNYEKVFSFV